jgi:hypothetical protein
VKVHKSSWHYKLYRYVTNIPQGPKYLNPWVKGTRTDKEVPRSICPYAWSIFMGLIGAVVLTPFMLIGTILVGLFVYAMKFSRWFDGRVWLIKKRRGAKKRKVKQEKVKHPSLIAAYVKARKDNVCPTIELVD